MSDLCDSFHLCAGHLLLACTPAFSKEHALIQWFNDYTVPGTACAFVFHDDEGNVGVVTHPSRIACLLPAEKEALLNRLLREVPELTPAVVRPHLRLLA